jgi:uncharacterized protein (TIGR02271 family)
MTDLTGRTVVTAFFDDRGSAQSALMALRNAGVPEADLRLMEGSQGGAGAAGAGGGSGLWEGLSDLFLPDEDRSTYSEGLRRGGYLLAVTTSAVSPDRIYDILDTEGAVDLTTRESQWRAEGWTGQSGANAFGQTASIGTNRSGEEIVEAAEERLVVGKRDVSHGRVRIRSYVVETPVQEQVSLHNERVFVERRPVDRAISAADPAFEERTIEAQEWGEEAVVSKEARVTEEIAVNKQVEERTETISDTVRKQEVEIEDTRTTPGLRNTR